MIENNKEKSEEKNDKEEKKSEEVLKQELAAAQKKAEEYLAGWKRAKADYINFKKETEKRQLEIIQFANAALIFELLPIADHFKQAIKKAPENLMNDEWVKGVLQIQRQTDDFLKKLGVEPIKTLGKKFNPEMHEAVGSEEKEGRDSGVIFEEVSGGYTLYGKVLKPAKVKVAKW